MYATLLINPTDFIAYFYNQSNPKAQGLAERCYRELPVKKRRGEVLSNFEGVCGVIGSLIPPTPLDKGGFDSPNPGCRKYGDEDVRSYSTRLKR